MDDVRKAAERKRNPSGYTRINGERRSPEENADNETLARAWLAEHQAAECDELPQLRAERDRLLRCLMAAMLVRHPSKTEEGVLFLRVTVEEYEEAREAIRNATRREMPEPVPGPIRRVQ